MKIGCKLNIYKYHVNIQVQEEEKLGWEGGQSF